MNDQKVLFDASVVVHYIWEQDDLCRDAMNRARTVRHRHVVCEKLLNEYRGVIARKSGQWFQIVGIRLMSVLPEHLLERHPDPTVMIDFGPEEDRFLLQLAMNASADFLVTRDCGVLAVANEMSVHEVNCCRPEAYTRAAKRKSKRSGRASPAG